MPTTKLKCRCKLGYKCSAPLHGEIEIITCERRKCFPLSLPKRIAALGCDKPIKRK